MVNPHSCKEDKNSSGVNKKNVSKASQGFFLCKNVNNFELSSGMLEVKKDCNTK
jgi:hypothetical protein